MLVPWEEDYKRYKKYIKATDLEDQEKHYLEDKLRSLSKTIPRFKQDLRRKVQKLSDLMKKG